MIIRKTFRFGLCPTKRQLHTFVSFAGGCRWVYNRGLAERKRAREEDRSIGLCEKKKELSSLKHAVGMEWLGGIYSQLYLACDHFFRRSRKEKDLFRYPQEVRVKDGQAWLPKIDSVRFCRSRAIESKIKQATVIKQGGFWYIYFQEPTTSCSDRVIGIDVDLEGLATMAYGKGFEKIASPNSKYLGCQLSKKVKRARNWGRAKGKLRVRSRRQNFLHQHSTKFLNNHDVVVVENLKVKQLLGKSVPSMVGNILDPGASVVYRCIEITMPALN